MALPAHALKMLPVRYKSPTNEGYFTLVVETVFRPYLLSHCSEFTEICHSPLPAHALTAVQASLQSFSNEGYFTLDA
jgi:hypothetical protein